MKTFKMNVGTIDFELEKKDGSMLQFEAEYPDGFDMKNYRENEVKFPGSEGIAKNMASIIGTDENSILADFKWDVISMAYSYFFEEVTNRCKTIPPVSAGK